MSFHYDEPPKKMNNPPTLCTLDITLFSVILLSYRRIDSIENKSTLLWNEASRRIAIVENSLK